MQAYLQDASLADVRLVDKLKELRGHDKIKVQWPPGCRLTCKLLGCIRLSRENPS